MIIECINCNKKFNVDDELIPENGRQIQCGSCNHSWHYKIDKSTAETLILEENFDNTKVNLKEKTSEILSTKLDNDPEKKIHPKITKNINLKRKTTSETHNDIKQNSFSNFFSYLVVFIISLLALIILIDTIKLPLINLFPDLELILFNLYETFKDIKLFIIDLT